MKNKAKVNLFIFFLLFIIVGGFILMKKSEGYITPSNTTNKEVTQTKDIRIDDTKEYIYYENYELIEHELDLEYKDVVLNFKDDNNIAKTLNDETKSLRATVTYDDTLEDTTYNKLSSAEYKIYEILSFDKYISLIVNYFDFNKEDLVSYKNTKTYVFDKTTGDLLTTDNLLEKYNLTKEKVKDIINAHLEDQALLKEEETLDIEGTLNNIGSLELYIDKLGKLSISILVKSDVKDYNEVIILN